MCGKYIGIREAKIRQAEQEKGTGKQREVPRSSQFFLVSLLFGLSCDNFALGAPPSASLGLLIPDFFQESHG